jgi:precorrin-3B methylase
VHEKAVLDEATGQLFCGADGVVYFYNAASRSSFHHVEAIHDKLQKIKSASTPSVLVGIALAGTKREVSFKEGNELARKLGCNFSVETEATVGDASPDNTVVSQSTR